MPRRKAADGTFAPGDKLAIGVGYADATYDLGGQTVTWGLLMMMVKTPGLPMSSP